MQIGQVLPLLVGGLVRRGIERLGHGGEQLGIDRVCLGQPPGGMGEGTSPSRIDPGKAHAGGLHLPPQLPVVVPGCLQQHQLGRRQATQVSRNRLRRVGNLPCAAVEDVQMILRNVDSDEAR